MNLVLLGLTWNTLLSFLDDALVLGKDIEDHLTSLRKFDLKFKPKKWATFKRRVEFLGGQVSHQGVEMGDSHSEAVRLPAALLKMWIEFWVSPTTIEVLSLVTLNWHFPSTA